MRSANGCLDAFVPFIPYRHLGQIEGDLIAGGQEERQTPEYFVRWYGEKYDVP